MPRPTDGLPPPAEKRLAELTDKIVAVSLALQPLCNDSTGLSRDSRQTVRQSCELLRSVSEELVALLRPLVDGDGRRDAPTASAGPPGSASGHRAP